MKQRFSVWTLALRPVFLPLLLLLSAAGAAQYLFFRRALSAAVRRLGAGQGLQYAFSFETLVEDGPSALILGIVFLLAALLFFFAAGDTAGGRVNDTLGRLAVPEKEIHLWWSALFALLFLLIAVWQILLLFAMLALWLRSPLGAYAGGHPYLLACWRSPLLHSLLPLGDLTRWLRNLILSPCLGLCLSVGAYFNRRGRRTLLPLWPIGLTMAFFVQETASFGTDLLLTVLVLLSTLSLVVSFWRDDRCAD